MNDAGDDGDLDECDSSEGIERLGFSVDTHTHMCVYFLIYRGVTQSKMQSALSLMEFYIHINPCASCSYQEYF